MDSLFYLFIAYTFIWILIFWYTRRLDNRLKTTQEELTLLKKSLQDRFPTGG
ncbi:CcmD family protein [Desulfitobacterium sp.]|uniref:CcmD family protein n=1 Tax=Desulfitobacterium sp. TaxID=49981 RepID=UPI002C8C444C|nr:CcmD family protein [Desulfitobacterium sp.]HVJ47683.1 CcmD family protein [Desulfitobacterium sp.]